MKIIVNGQPQELAPNIPLKNLIDQFCPNNRPVIAEINGHIIKSSHWQAKILADGDTIELVSFVGGG